MNPRVRSRVSLQADILRAQSRPVMGAEARRPYDNVDLQEVVAKLQGEVGAEDRRPYDNVEVMRQAYGSIGPMPGGQETADPMHLPVAHRAGHPSDFLESLLALYFKGSPYVSVAADRPKSVAAAVFGEQHKEEGTITWGQTVDLSLPQGANSNFSVIGLQQTIHANRNHPTTHTILSHVFLSAGWDGNIADALTIAFIYILGIGTTKIRVQRQIVFNNTAPNQAPNTGLVLFATDTVPFMSIQGEAHISALTTAKTVNLGISATSLVAPVVQ